MKYQLVLQLPASSTQEYDKMIELEETMIRDLGKLGNVDGPDAGSGEMNIFIMTNKPQQAFERIKTLPVIGDFLPNLKVAYRGIGEKDFAVIYPPGLTNFVIK